MPHTQEGMLSEERAVLRAGPLRALPDEVLDELLVSCGRRVCVGGEIIIEEGDDDREAYVVLHGRLRVLRTEVATNGSAPAVTAVAEIGPGEMVGEMALLAQGRRTASVVAVRDTELLVLSEAVFRGLTEQNVATLRHMAELIVTRSTAATLPLSRPSVVAVVTDGPDTEWFSPLLAAGFEAENRVILDVLHAAPDDLRSVVRRAELQGEVVLLVAEAADRKWAEAAVRQADVVMPVAARRGSPCCEAVQDWLADHPRPPRVDAVTLDDAPAPSSSLAGNVWRHRVRAGSTADAERLVRLVSGDATTLVLGSGSARGLAHLGVVQAFQERGVPIDAIGGTSAGAVVAGMFATGRSIEQMRQDLINFIDDVKWSRDLIFPRFSVLSGRQLSDEIENYFDGKHIEDLPLDLFTVATDLGTGTAVVDDRGPVWRAVRASAAIPGVFPPVRSGSSLLGDGAIVDRLPVGVMRRRHPQARVVSVDLATPNGLAPSGYAEDGRVSWRRALWPGRRTRGLGAVMGRIIELTGSTDDVGDVTIRPEIGELSLRDGTKAVDAAMAAGRTAALDVLDTIHQDQS
ncbi:MAG: patatin-like phospholipase family protein [Actinomycetota bacterium]